MNVKPKLKVHIKPNKRIETPEAIVYAPSPKLTWLQIFTSAAQTFLALLPISASLGGVIIYFYLNKYGLGSLYAEFIKDIDVWIITSAILIVLLLFFYMPVILLFLPEKINLFSSIVNQLNPNTRRQTIDSISSTAKCSNAVVKFSKLIDYIIDIFIYIFIFGCFYEGFEFFLGFSYISSFISLCFAIILISIMMFTSSKQNITNAFVLYTIFTIFLYTLFLLGIYFTNNNEEASYLFKRLGVEEDKNTYSWYKVSDTFTKKLNHSEIQYLKDKFLLPAQPIIKNKQTYKQYWRFSGFDNSIYIYGNMRISTPNIKILCPMKGYIINEKNEITKLDIPYSTEVGTHCMRFQKDDLLKVEEYLKVP